MAAAALSSALSLAGVLVALRTEVQLALLRSFLSTVNDDSQQQVYNRFQTKFYKSLKGYIMKDELGVQDIELEVPFFYNELNLNVKWSYLHEDSIQPKDYVVEDLDYKFKKNLFENYQY